MRFGSQQTNRPGDKDGARRLNNHLKKVAQCAILVPENVGSSRHSDDELQCALLAMKSATVPVPPPTLLALVDRRAAELCHRVHSAKHLDDVRSLMKTVLPWTETENADFDTLNPRLGALLPTLSPQSVMERMRPWVFKELVHLLIQTSTSDGQKLELLRDTINIAIQARCNNVSVWRYFFLGASEAAAKVWSGNQGM